MAFLVQEGKGGSIRSSAVFYGTKKRGRDFPGRGGSSGGRGEGEG